VPVIVFPFVKGVRGILSGTWRKFAFASKLNLLTKNRKNDRMVKVIKIVKMINL